MYSLDNLLKKYKEKYSIKCVSGAKGLSRAVSWVYFAEDIENVDFVKGSLLLITTGYFTTNGVSLYDFIRAYMERGTAGMIVNTGKYINEIPEDVKELCERNNYPVFIMPWEVHVTYVMQELCGVLFQNTQRHNELSEAFRDIIFNNGKKEYYYELFREHGFDGKEAYSIINIAGGAFDKLQNRIDTGREKAHIMLHNGNAVIITTNPGIADVIASHEFEECKAGVSSKAYGLENLDRLYEQSMYALRAARIMNEKIAVYDNIGIYKLIFAVDDREMLRELYMSRLSALEEYDRAHNASLVETLFYYLKTGGSLSETADLMYTHRNTVGYRLNKIKLICGAEFDSAEEKYDYLTALYIRKAAIAEGWENY